MHVKCQIKYTVSSWRVIIISGTSISIPILLKANTFDKTDTYYTFLDKNLTSSNMCMLYFKGSNE